LNKSPPRLERSVIRNENRRKAMDRVGAAVTLPQYWPIGKKSTFLGFEKRPTIPAGGIHICNNSKSRSKTVG
jgi:hypothetical protein